MTVILPTGLPAASLLRGEGVAVLTGDAAARGEAPLDVLLVNLMPDKPRAETQFARLLAVGPRAVRLHLALPDGYCPRHVPAAHLRRFYRPWRDVVAGGVDAVIVTGAPVELLPFEAVRYWDGLVDLLDATDGVPSLFVCWAAQAALWHHHGVPKHTLPRKRSGVYLHHAVQPDAPLLAGLRGPFAMPVSRHTEVRLDAVSTVARLRPVAVSAPAGLALVEDPSRDATYLFNHPEYDAGTLDAEYRRDLARDAGTAIPVNYYPDDDPGRTPVRSWAGFAWRLYRNWLAGVAATRAAPLPVGLAAQARASQSFQPTSGWSGQYSL